MAEINITPFTDVLLVLLIIFMILAALSAPPGFEKQLGKSSNSTATKQNNKNSIEIDVTSRGLILVDGTKATAETVYFVLANDIHKRGKKHISIIADAKAPYGIIIRILDAARLAGSDDVGFVTS
jgi:biopolymer transport protein ExbD